MQPNGPDYSIVVPTYRRRDASRAAFRPLSRWIFERDRFELLVVDDGSPIAACGHRVPSLDPVARRATGARAPRRTGDSAQHRRASSPAGRYLVFTDDDCLPRRDWLRSIDRWISVVAERRRRSADTSSTCSRTTSTSTASQGIIDYLYEYFGDHPAPRRFFTTNNLVVLACRVHRSRRVRRDVRARGARRIAISASGGSTPATSLEYAADVVVEPRTRCSAFARFNRQHFIYGRGAVRPASLASAAR